MNLRDARRLRPGDRINFGLSMWTRHQSRTFDGEVMHVTPRGGVRVKVLSEDKTRVEDVVWVPYHYVNRRIDG